MVAEGAGDLLVREAEPVGRPVDALDRLLDREVSGLDQKRQDRGLLRLVDRECLLWRLRGVEVDGRLPDHLHQERRRPRLEPPVLEFACVEALADGDGIEHVRAVPVEAVSVVPMHEPGERLVARRPERRGEGVEVLGEVREDLLVRVAEQGRRTGVHREVGEIVQVREDRDLGELRDACHEDEALQRLGGLHDGVERLERGLDARNLRPPEQAQQRLVVFVDQDRDLPGRGLRGGGAAEVPEPRRNGIPGFGLEPEVVLDVGELTVEPGHEFGPVARLGRAHVEVDHGNRRPVPRQRVDREALEQLAACLEKGLDRRYQERLAEPPRPREEILGRDLRRQGVDGRRLVDVDGSSLDEPGERERAGGNRLHGADFSKPRLPPQSDGPGRRGT